MNMQTTGGAGYIGSHAVLALLDSGWPVVVLDNLSTGFCDAVDPRAAFVEGDAGDIALARDTLARHKIAAIMHFAGSIIVPESVADPLKYYRNNTANSRSLIESAVKGGVRHFIFSSTAATTLTLLHALVALGLVGLVAGLLTVASVLEQRRPAAAPERAARDTTRRARREHLAGAH